MHNQGWGLINNHYFTDEFVRAVYQAVSKSGVDYMVTGILNEHPRSAIAPRKTDRKDKYAEFYQEMCQSPA